MLPCMLGRSATGSRLIPQRCASSKAVGWLSATGAGGSRSSAMGTAALRMAKNRNVEKGAEIAVRLMEAAVDDIAFDSGAFSVAGTDRTVTFGVVKAAFDPASLLDGPGLSSHAVYRGTVANCSGGCHAREVEIDPETGAATIESYVVVDDFGTVLDQPLVERQVHGEVARGAGQALLESALYDEEGQVLTASLMNYAMPRVAEFCSFQVKTSAVQTTANPLGVKGVGEAGAVGDLSAAMNAIADALAFWRIDVPDMPATLLRFWTTIQEARSARGT